MKNLDSLIANVVSAALYGITAKRLGANTDFVLITLGIFIVLINAYRYIFFRRKIIFAKGAPGETDMAFRKWLIVSTRAEFSIFTLLLVMVAGQSLWITKDLREDKVLKAQIVRESIDYNLQEAITAAIRTREEEVFQNTDHYSFQKAVIGLAQDGRTGIVVHKVHGFPRVTTDSESPPFLFAYSGEAPVERVGDFVEFERLSADFSGSAERKVVSVRRGITRGGISSYLLAVPGFSEEFWIRRTICWPATLFRTADAFVVDLGEYNDVGSVEVNFASSDLVDPSIVWAIDDPSNNKLARLDLATDVTLKGKPDTDWAMTSGPAERRFEIRTARSWVLPPVRKSRFLVILYTKLPEPRAEVASLPDVQEESPRSDKKSATEERDGERYGTDSDDKGKS